MPRYFGLRVGTFGRYAVKKETGEGSSSCSFYLAEANLGNGDTVIATTSLVDAPVNLFLHQKLAGGVIFSYFDHML